jgi:hypothetical protein
MGWINSSDIHYPWTLQIVGEVFAEFRDVRWITGISSFVDEGSCPRGIDPETLNKYDLLYDSPDWIQQESTFWRRDLWQDSGGGLDTSLRYGFEKALWLQFALRTDLHQVESLLGGFRIHGDRISPSEKDALRHRQLYEEFRSHFGTRDRVCASLVKHTRTRNRRPIRVFLYRLGLMTWYEKPRIRRDFDNRRWFQKRADVQ